MNISTGVYQPVVRYVVPVGIPGRAFKTIMEQDNPRRHYRFVNIYSSEDLGDSGRIPVFNLTDERRHLLCITNLVVDICGQCSS